MTPMRVGTELQFRQGLGRDTATFSMGAGAGSAWGSLMARERATAL